VSTISDFRKRTDVEELDKLLSLIAHLNRKYEKHWIGNEKLKLEAERYVQRVKAKLPLIYERLEDGNRSTN
jgi:hypothetical protein